MMAENPDAEYPAAPVYSYFKPPDKKRTTPYSRAAWKSRRWCWWVDNGSEKPCFVYLESSDAFVLCRAGRMLAPEPSTAVRGAAFRNTLGGLLSTPSRQHGCVAERCAEK